MELQFKGANCVTLQTKKAKVVIDDNLKELGLPSVSDKADIAIYTSRELFKNRGGKDTFVIDGPGEYEISEISVKGIPARAHMDEDKKHTATVYRIAVGSTMICVLGHVFEDLSDDQLEALGMIDILIVPVGNSGYTLDAKGAEKLIKKIDPKIVIPTHYADSNVKFEVPQASLEEFTKEMSVTPEKVDKLKFKNDIFPENLVVYHLERTA